MCDKSAEGNCGEATAVALIIVALSAHAQLDLVVICAAEMERGLQQWQ